MSSAYGYECVCVLCVCFASFSSFSFSLFFPLSCVLFGLVVCCFSILFVPLLLSFSWQCFLFLAYGPPVLQFSGVLFLVFNRSLFVGFFLPLVAVRSAFRVFDWLFTEVRLPCSCRFAAVGRPLALYVPLCLSSSHCRLRPLSRLLSFIMSFRNKLVPTC